MRWDRHLTDCVPIAASDPKRGSLPLDTGTKVCSSGGAGKRVIVHHVPSILIAGRFGPCGGGRATCAQVSARGSICCPVPQTRRHSRCRVSTFKLVSSATSQRRISGPDAGDSLERPRRTLRQSSRRQLTLEGTDRVSTYQIDQRILPFYCERPVSIGNDRQD